MRGGASRKRVKFDRSDAGLFSSGRAFEAVREDAPGRYPDRRADALGQAGRCAG
jgi:hypothetical protein